MDLGAAIVPPREAGRAFVECAAAHGRARLSDLDGMAEFCAAADAVIAAADPVGLALYSGAAAQPMADDPPARAMQLVALLREYRGGVHLVAIRASGLDALTAHCVKRPQDLAMFGWSDDDAVEITDADREAWNAAEALTDQLVLPAYSALDEAGRQAFVAGLDRIEAASRRADDMTDAPLAGRIAVVTGGAAGIGGATSRRLAAAGATVVVNDIDGDLLATTVAEIGAAGHRVEPVAGDIRLAATVGELAHVALGVAGGRIDVLVNNVGDYRPNGRFLKTAEPEWDALYAVNLEHVFRCTRAFAPAMVEAGSGSIVNVSTVEAFRGIPANAVYSAFNAGINAFTRSLAVELGRDGVRVNAIAPDLADTLQTPADAMLAGRDPRWSATGFPSGGSASPRTTPRCAVPGQRPVAVRHRPRHTGRRGHDGGERLVPAARWPRLDQPARLPLTLTRPRSSGPASASCLAMKDDISNSKTRDGAKRSTGTIRGAALAAAVGCLLRGQHRPPPRLRRAYLATTPSPPADRVLDLGCGSGDFTRIVADLVPQGEVVGLDPQPALLAEARACAGPNQTFVRGPRAAPRPAAARRRLLRRVVSRAAMQWVPMADHPGYLAAGAAPAASRAGGSAWRWAAPATSRRRPLGGRRSRWPTAGRPRPWSFPDAGPYLELLEAGRVHRRPAEAADYVRTTAQRRAFDRDVAAGVAAQPVLPGLRDRHAGRSATPRSGPRSRPASTSCADPTAPSTRPTCASTPSPAPRLSAPVGDPGVSRRSGPAEATDHGVAGESQGDGDGAHGPDPPRPGQPVDGRGVDRVEDPVGEGEAVEAGQHARAQRQDDHGHAQHPRPPSGSGPAGEKAA